MSSPLDQVTYDNGPQYLIWKTYSGNYEDMVVMFPFDITDYAFSGEVINDGGTKVCDITAAKSITGTLPNLVYKVSNVILPADTLKITPNCTFNLKWVQSSIYPKTYISGPIEAGNNG